MKRWKGSTVNQLGVPGKTPRLEEPGLLDPGAVLVRKDLELKPCRSGQFHLRAQTQQTRWLEYFHPPEVRRCTGDRAPVWAIRSRAAHRRTSR